jgi:hypothetical protein
VPDFLDDKRREITARLSELEPVVDEYNRLTAAAAALDGIGESTAVAVPVRRGPGRPRGSGSKTESMATAPAKKRGRPPGRKKVGRPKTKKVGRPPGASATGKGRRKGSGTRSMQALSVVNDQPGITIPELAKKMGIKQNYLYRVLPALEQEGKIVKQGRGWHPKTT